MILSNDARSDLELFGGTNEREALDVIDAQAAELESAYEALGAMAIEKARLEAKLKRLRALADDARKTKNPVYASELYEALSDE